jgi:ABC-type multidrug transport system fused ATPase/permease subunit
MLQTFADLRGMLASVRRVRATLGELPPDESMAGVLPPLPEQPWEMPQGVGGAGGDEAAAVMADEGWAPPPANGRPGPTAADGGGGRAVEAATTGDLRLEGVSFSYPVRPGAPVLRDLSLTLPRGKVTALVGRCLASWQMGGGPGTLPWCCLCLCHKGQGHRAVARNVCGGLCMTVW